LKIEKLAKIKNSYKRTKLEMTEEIHDRQLLSILTVGLEGYIRFKTSPCWQTIY